jgi:flagellar protein FliS
MNALQTYRKQQQPKGTTRIDVLLSLYDGAIKRMLQAEEPLRAGNVPAATPFLSKCQLIVSELAAGVRIDLDPVTGPNLLRLYEYVVFQLAQAKLEGVRHARTVLQTVREGFEAIRLEAVELERRGEVVASDNLRTVLTSA